MIRLRVVAAGLLLMGATSSPGEDADALAPGTRLRVFARTLGSKPLVRVLQSLRANALILAAEGHPSAVAVPRQEVTRIDRSGGRHSRGRWAIRGAGLGLLAGVAIGLAAGDTCTGQFIDVVTLGSCSAGAKAAVGALLGVPAGALIGLAVPPGERWEHVPLHQGRSTAVYPSRLRNVVSVTISFYF
jgi:hypothetical protein